MRINRFSIGTRPYFRLPGIDFGADLQIYKEGKRYILAQVKGHIAWISLGTFKYQHPRFLIFDKQKDDRDAYIEIKGWKYTRETRKEILKEALDFFDKLEVEDKDEGS